MLSSRKGFRREAEVGEGELGCLEKRLRREVADALGRGDGMEG